MDQNIDRQSAARALVAKLGGIPLPARTASASCDAALPHTGAALPHTGAALPHTGAAFPFGGAAFPFGGAAFPFGGAAFPFGGSSPAGKLATTMEAPRLRRARLVTIVFEPGGPVAVDCHTARRARLDRLGFELLSQLDAWTAPDAAFAQLAGPTATDAERAAIATSLIALLDAGLVVAEGSDEAAADQRRHEAWEWGPFAAAFHNGIRDTPYATGDALAAGLAARMDAAPAVELVRAADADARRLALPPLDHPLLSLLRRRSRRGFADAPVPLEALRDCLFGALAIVGFTDFAGPGSDRLPLKMTPSGGARNPYDAYVCVRRVEGLPAGVYRYAGVDNSLTLVRDGAPESFAALVGDQSWFEGAGVMIVLVATFRRTMRKYAHPTAFRVVLLEAGHIAQNILLSAAHHGLAATPTCAVSDSRLVQLLGLDEVIEAPIYAIPIGVPGEPRSVADFATVEENPELPGWLRRA